MKKIAILGASGSIGQSCIEVIRKHPSSFSLVAMSVYTQIDLLPSLLNEFQDLQIVAVKDLMSIPSYILKYPHIKFVEGDKGLVEVATSSCDLVVNALVGFVGLIPTIQAILNHKEIALANKETLVAGGEVVMRLAKENQVHIYPIDSEHSAIFQCMEKNEIHKIILTASGGPFYQKSLEEVENVSIHQALNHPNWKMGAKITIDSATMFNKAFEMIEARWLFDLSSDQIEVAIHPQSIIHSMVEYQDGAILAQLGTPDMKIPIAYALNYPQRLNHVSSFLNLKQMQNLNFYPVDNHRFEPIQLAYQALKEKGTYATVMNAANEEAVQFFLQEKISFGAITRFVKATLKAHHNDQQVTLEKIIAADQWARDYIRRLVNQ